MITPVVRENNGEQAREVRHGQRNRKKSRMSGGSIPPRAQRYGDTRKTHLFAF